MASQIKSIAGIIIVLAFAVPEANHSNAQDLPDCYHTYQEVVDTVGALAGLYPDIMYVDTMGYSTRDSIPMIRIKLSDDASIDEDEPAVFFNGGVHADEVLSVEVMMRFLNDITDLYSQSDSQIINYINELEIFVVPMINPEGHLVVEGGDLDWRKNKSDNDSNNVFDFHDGVDNNRNYDFGWDIDDEPDAVAPESLQFKGWAPFTESENIAMAEFGWKYRPLIALDHHSPTYGRPNVAYYPWYWYASEGGHGFSPDENLMQSICQQYTSQIFAIPDDSGTVTYTARRALVNKGDLKTYFYGNFGTAAFVVEISDTTIQNQALVDSIAEAHLPGLYWLLGRALGPGINGVIRDSITFEPIEAEVQVLQHINDDINPRLSRPDFGRYRRLLAPGTYTLRFIKDGYHTKTVYNVVVGSSNPTETNVYLSPVNPIPPSPVLISPVDSSTIESEYLYFSWERSPGATGYIIEIAEDASFTQIIEYDSAVVSESYTNLNPFENGNYFWRCTAFNGNGYSENSETWLFTVSLSPVPAPPTLLYPVDVIVDTSIITFEWEDAEGADGYIFEVAFDLGFLDLIEFDSSLNESSYENLNALSNGEYCWRVTAFNSYGYSDRCVASFEVELDLPVPVLQSPGEGYHSTSPYINFNWFDISGADNYLIEISSSEDFVTLSIFDSTLTNSEYTNADSLANGNFYWRVKAYIEPFWGNYCTPWEFYVDVDTSTVIFMPGDANGDWQVIGSDVTFLVNFFRGLVTPPIEVDGYYPGADANGDCLNIGSDVTYLVNYFRGGPLPVDGNCF